MTGRSSSKDASVRDWVNSTLYGDALRPPATLSRRASPKESFHGSSLELQAGLEVQEFSDTMPVEFSELFDK